MEPQSKRSTIYFDPELHRALRIKAANTQQTLSELGNEAVRQSLREDREDLKSFADRIAEPTMTYEELLDDLKSHGKL